MSDIFEFNLIGWEQLMRNFEELPTASMKKTVVRNALKKALVPVRDAAKQNAPVGETGDLQKSIKIGKLKPSQRKGKPQDRTVVTQYVGSTSRIAPYLEFGTEDRTLDAPSVVPIGGNLAQVESTGRISARPFLRPAWDANKGKLLELFAKEMRPQLNKSAARLAKRGAAGKLTKSQIRGLRG
jgi:HK97 gp10 family phage protein